MKTLFCALLCFALSARVNLALAQYGSSDNTTYYEGIRRNIRSEDDRTNLFLALKVADLRRSPDQTDEARDKCLVLFELCENSIKDPAFYSRNKEIITDLVSSIFMLQQPLFRNQFISKVHSDYNDARYDKYFKSLIELKQVNGTDSAQSVMSFIENELAASRDKDSTDFISVMVNNNLNSLVQGIAARLEKTQSVIEVDRLLALTNYIIERKYDPELERDIAFKVSEALKPGFLDMQNYLGDLLLAGYKKLLAGRKRIPVNPRQEDVRSVYEFVIAGSNQLSLNRNILIAQTNLLERKILTCQASDVARVQRGWNWASNDDRLNLIPFVMLNKTREDIIRESKWGAGNLDLSSEYYLKRKEIIKQFNYKFDKFSGLHRISRGVKPLIFDDPLLAPDEVQKPAGCKLIYYINREGFYEFPNHQ